MKSSRLGGLKADCFRFLNCSFEARTGEAVLAYAFDDGEPLYERIVFPLAPWPGDASRQAAFRRALELLHLVAGVSYYKTCVPAQMDPVDHRLDADLAAFLRQLYVRGLGEFAYLNAVDLQPRVNFPVNATRAPRPLDLDLPERALLAVGGGKDSLVSLEMLREAGLEVQPAWVGESALIAATVKAAGLPLLRIRRTLSPTLAEMNAAGALNGHVPVTAINSAILLCASILYGFSWVVFSNESSASEPTLTDAGGRQVNHQYSKGVGFERGLREVVRQRLSPAIEYFSLLRPLSELAIAERFSKLTKYHGVFSSCNRNFHADGPRISGRWCGDCPKCRFTTLALAMFMPPDAITGFMGFDLLNEPGQETGFRALCRLGVEKPFECVGGVDECRAALGYLADRPEWNVKAMVRKLAPELDGYEIPALDELMQAGTAHHIPEEILRRVDF